MRYWFLAVLWMVSGCASLLGDGAKEKKEEPVAAAAPAAQPAAPQVSKEAELKLAKILARMEELENELIRQKERMRLLERGLVTGIVPDELSKDPGPAKDKKKAEGEAKPIVAPIAVAQPAEPIAPPAPTPAAAPPTPAPTPESTVAVAPAAAATPAPQNNDEKGYQEKLSRAHALFSGEHWGQAIAAYGAIGQEFPETMTQGHPTYWIGLSWFYLKEYQLAEKNLTDFLNRYAASPLAPRAQFYLAKTEFQMGLVEKAVSRFKNVIRDFPADEAAKMAQLEMSRLDQAL